MNISSPVISSKANQNSLRTSAQVAKHLLELRPPRVPKVSGAGRRITVVCISDTHNTRPPLPLGDILLHAGDLSQYGTFPEIQAQLNWLDAQPHKHKVVIAGNHDLLLDPVFAVNHPDRELDKSGSSARDLQWGSIVYLQDSSTTLQIDDRSVCIFGSPWTPMCGNFAFQHERDEDIWVGKVPEGIDIFMTQGPPATQLDNGKGCEHLLAEIWRMKPLLVVFGHIHEANGKADLDLSPIQNHYQSIMLGKRGWLAVIHLLLLVTWEGTLRLFGRKQKHKVIQLVNAALDQKHENGADFEAIKASI